MPSISRSDPLRTTIASRAWFLSLGAAGALAVGILSAAPVQAQTAPDTIVVFDGSGSMNAAIGGRTKIEIARDTLSSVLSESVNDMRIGMIAYGHRFDRRERNCRDIETVVPVGPAQSTVPAMIGAANRLTPQGMTPLTEAVRAAAEEMRFTEVPATVVLITDGIETCDADPCALGAELEAAGIDFTAHVVGFGLSDEEGRQVQCLADNTGGRYIQASDAGELSDALARTIAPPIEPNENDFVDPVPAERNVVLRLRDVTDGPLLTARNAQVVFEPAGEGAGSSAPVELFYSGENTGSVTLMPGDYAMLVRRSGNGGYKVRVPVTVEAGEGNQIVDMVLGGLLTTEISLNARTPYSYDARPSGAVNGSAWLYQNIIAIEPDGSLGEVVASVNSRELANVPLPAGRYVWRGTIDRTTTVDRIIEVAAGEPTTARIDMDVWPVHLDARDADGFPVSRQTTYPYDGVPGEVEYWRRGTGGVGDNGQTEPFWMGRGTWGFSVGQEGGGDSRGWVLIAVDGTGEVRRRVEPGERPSDTELAALRAVAGTQCLDFYGAGHTGCVIERPTEAALRGEGDGVERGGAGTGEAPAETANLSPGDAPTVAPAPGDAPMPGDDPAPDTVAGGPFQGLWSTQHGGVALRQEGDRVYGDYLGRNGMIVGRMQDDGRTLRGIFIYPGGNRWGGVEWRLSEDGTALAGGWADAVPADAASGNWNGTRSNAEAPALVHWPELDANWWLGVDAAPRGTIEAWAGGPLMAEATQAPLAPGDDPSAADASAGDAPAVQPRSDGGGMPAELAGLSGTAYAFTGPNDAIGLHVVIDDASEAATIVLSEGWCGVPACEGGRASVQRDRVSTLEEDGYRSASFGANSYQFELSSFGERKIANVSGEGASRVRFDLFDRIELGGAAGGQGAPVITSADGSGAAAPFVGAFTIDASDMSAAELAADAFTAQECQRNPMIAYPDGTLAFKRFTEPKAAGDNPYAGQMTSARCEVADGRYSCELTAQSGNTQALNFSVRPLDGGHFEWCEEGRDGCNKAVACFGGGDGQLDAAMDTPLGMTLGEAMIVRPDGSAPGFAFGPGGTVVVQ